MLDDHIIQSLDDLAALLDPPREVSIRKESATLTPLERDFVEASPFYLLATANPAGECDVSPRGDPAGSVQVRGNDTLILPDRAGNNRIDSLRNIVGNPQVGLLFLVPGQDETLRVNGTAHLTTDPELLASLGVQGKQPKLAIVVKTTAVFMHCARAFRRSKLWDSATWPAQGTVPQMPAILKEKLAMAESVEDIAAEREARYKATLY